MTYTASDIGPYIKNKDNALELITWLSEGAMHSHFDINYSDCLRVNSSILNFEEAASDAPGVRGEVAASECGAVLCIGGAAYQMAKGVFGKVTKSNYSTLDTCWDEMEHTALEWLGIVVADDLIDCMWPIFDPDDWPADYIVTGEAAALAMIAYSQHGGEYAAIMDAVEGVPG